MAGSRRKRAFQRLLHALLTHSGAIGIILALISFPISLWLASTPETETAVRWIATTSAIIFSIYILYRFYFYALDKLAETRFKNQFNNNDNYDNLTKYNIYELFASFLDIEGLRLYGVRLGNDTTISDIILTYNKIIYFKEAPDHELAASVAKSRRIAYDIKYGVDRKGDEKLSAAPLLGNWEEHFRSYCAEMDIEYKNQKNILEVGFGTGQVYQEGKLFEEIYGAESGKKYITDISCDAIKLAKARFSGSGQKSLFFSRFSFLGCQSEFLDKTIPDNSIDLYLSLRTYSSSLFDIRRSIAEAKRVLRSGAAIVISIPHLYFKNEISYEIGLMRDVRAGKITKAYRDEVANEVMHYLNLFEFDDVAHSTRYPYETYISARRCIAR